MAANAPDTSKASATSQELQLFSEEVGHLPPAEEVEVENSPPDEIPAVETPLPPAELPALPPELRNVAASLEKALNDPAQLLSAFASFCGAAYVKPEWAGMASEYLSVLFEDNEDTLAEMTRIPDLIIELGSGHYTLTFMVASRWAAKSDLARLTRLAEALIATQSKMKNSEVVDLMLALTTSLAISRYSRAEQLLTAAQAHASESEVEALKEAELWLEAGSIVRGCTQEVRDLWDHRLRRPRVAWTWANREECAALAQLAESLDPTFRAASLFQAVVPAIWWDLLVTRAQQQAQYESALAAAKASAREQERQRDLSSYPETTPEPPRTVIRRPIIIWRGIPFFVGGLVGAWALLVGIWVSPFDLVRPAPEALATPPAAGSVITEPGVPAEEHPNTVWRKEQIAVMDSEVPDLQPWVEKIKQGAYAEVEGLLKGQSSDVPASDPRYEKMLRWLHLDPPSDVESRRQVPLLLANVRQDSTVIDLWEKLLYPSSPNAADIREAALRTLHDKPESWSATQRALLGKLGEPVVE